MPDTAPAPSPTDTAPHPTPAPRAAAKIAQCGPPNTPNGDNESLRVEAFKAIDRMSEALSGQWTGGISPAASALAYFDWAVHLAYAPGKQMELMYKAARKSAKLGAYFAAAGTNTDTPPAIKPLPDDHRFQHESWRKPPYSWMAQSFLLQQQWLHNATHEVPGVRKHHEDMVSFMARQMLDVFSPSNTPLTNPEVIERTKSSTGANFVNGFRNWLEDVSHQALGQPPVGAERFVPGQDVATTPGKVVYRNHLIELIQYEPTTKKVQAEPILIVPAWIMKYYILDLQSQNSMIRWLVDQGFTVFAISWHNPGPEDRNVSLDDYRRMGVMAAIDAIDTIVPGQKIHGAGYCLGGTLLTIAAAAMANAHDDRLGSVTLFAAQVDFTEPGEMALFIDPSQMHFLNSMMWNRGYLSADQMAGAFQMLRSNDLVWSRLVRDYMLGERVPMNDLMAWNADSTRMPYRMHSQYLQHLYLDNELAGGRFMVEDRPVNLQNIRQPVFVVGTERDHVAPWKSVYKIHHFCDSEITFVLASGGHNAGIVSPPGKPRRHYRVGTKTAQEPLLGPADWVAEHGEHPGSWWEEWGRWLAARSSGEVKPPQMGAPEHGYTPRCEAPGSYVFER